MKLEIIPTEVVVPFSEGGREAPVHALIRVHDGPCISMMTVNLEDGGGIVFRTESEIDQFTTILKRVLAMAQPTDAQAS